MYILILLKTIRNIINDYDVSVDSWEAPLPAERLLYPALPLRRRRRHLFKMAAQCRAFEYAPFKKRRLETAPKPDKAPLSVLSMRPQTAAES